MFILIAIAVAFAWAIGGEKYFGKWRRGVLVALGFTAAGLVSGLPWWYYPIIWALFWHIYQGLFYDDCIKMIWPDTGTTPVWKQALGWAGLGLNGLMTASMPLAYALARDGSAFRICLAVGIPTLGFPFICWLSNGLKFKFPSYCVIYDGVKLWCPEDTWWMSCWIFGLLLGGCATW